MAKIEVVMPQLGEGVIEATIIRWLVNTNDEVTIDEPIVEIATDKVDSEIPAPVTGKIIKKFYDEGDIPGVGDLLAIIGTSVKDNMPDHINDTADRNTKEESPNSLNLEQSDNLKKKTNHNFTGNNSISPFIRHFAKLRNISHKELELLHNKIGTDKVLTIEAIKKYHKSGRIQVPVKKNSTEAKPDVESYLKEGISENRVEEDVVEIDRTRKLIAERMVKSSIEIPHVTSFIEADVTDLVNWRESNKEDIREKYGVKVTYTPIITEVVVKALKKFPNINVSFQNDKIIHKKYYNIGIATALPDGNLVVPVIKGADRKNLISLAKEINALSDKAKRKSLLPGDTTEGTFTITNLGQFGNVTGTPIINHPESAILAVGAIKKKPGVVDVKGELTIGIRDIITLSLSYDHRIIDGTMGGGFLHYVSKLLEAFKSTI